MIPKKLSCQLLAAVLITGFTNCKKEESTVCDAYGSRISEMIGDFGKLQYYYDNDNKLIRIDLDGKTNTEFTYYGTDSIYQTNGTQKSSLVTYKLDRQGRLLRSHLITKDVTSLYAIDYSFSYNSNNQLAGYSTSNPFGDNSNKDSVTCYWENGNLVKEERPLYGMKATYYEYYPNTNGWNFFNTPTQLNWLIYNKNAHPVVSKNVLKRSISDTDTTVYDATFDAQGRISTYTIIQQGSSHTYTCKYDCN